jgi:hypothetical protein
MRIRADESAPVPRPVWLELRSDGAHAGDLPAFRFEHGAILAAQ